MTGRAFDSADSASGSQAESTTTLPRATLVRDLDEIARTASVMVDGDLSQRIVVGYSLREPEFTHIKKTLIRLSRLISYPCDVNLWMPVEGEPGRIQIVIRNENELSQFWVFGVRSQPMFPQMSEVLKTGRRVTVEERPGMVSVLAPVYNSLGDIVGLAEVVSKESFPCGCAPGD
jgi:hypothetical protein